MHYAAIITIDSVTNFVQCMIHEGECTYVITYTTTLLFYGKDASFQSSQSHLDDICPNDRAHALWNSQSQKPGRSNAAIHFCPACNLQFGVAVRETMANNTDGGDSLLIDNTSVTSPEWTLQDGRGRSWRMVFYGVWNQMLKIFNAILSILSLVVYRENLGISCPRDFPSKDCLS